LIFFNFSLAIVFVSVTVVRCPKFCGKLRPSSIEAAHPPPPPPPPGQHVGKKKKIVFFLSISKIFFINIRVIHLAPLLKLVLWFFKSCFFLFFQKWGGVAGAAFFAEQKMQFLAADFQTRYLRVSST
jgi:hypothetical protein